MARFQSTKMNPKKFERGQIKFYLILIPVAIFMGLPILYIFSHAFKPFDELFAFPPKFFVSNPTLDNFRMLFENMELSNIPVSRYIFNSFFVTITVVLFTVLICAMAAYALSKKKFRLKSLIFEINTLALMFVAAAVTIPRYFVIVNLGLVDSMLSHILPILVMPMGIFLVKQFVDQIPDSLIEAAKIDGAGDLTIFLKIILPLIKPALATVAILSFQVVWTSVEASTMFINNESMKTFAFYISTLTSTNGGVAGQGMAAAASLIMFVPSLVVFIFMQNKVMDTMAHSGIK